jgi:drug/metabolite transporter (DMT)-like permease
VNKTKPADILILILMCILFGLTFIATKFALGGLGIFQVVFGRYCLAFLVLVIVFRKKRHYFSIASHDIKHFLTLTMVEPVGYFIMETYGIQYSSPSSVSLIIATIPIFAMISAFFILRERLSLINVSGIFISILGVYFIVTLQKSTELAPQPVLGNFLTLGAAMAAGLYNSLARRLAQKYSPLTLTYYQTFVATIVFFPLATIEYFLSDGIHADAFIIGNVFYLAIGGSIFAYFLLNRALSHLGSAQVAVFANFIPVVTIIISYFAFNELLRPIQFAGAGCVLIGIYLTYKQKPVD